VKTIITLTDTPEGGVDVQYMTQLTTEEIAQGFNPQDSAGYKAAYVIHSQLETARKLEAATRLAGSAKREQGTCLH
jgi:hypothetical protein